MDIRAYLKDRGMSQREFGELLGVSQACVSLWLTNDRRIDGDWAVKIEKKTKGAITREEVRPDLFRRRNGGDRAA